MTPPQEFFAYFRGELTENDRIALDRPGFALYENGVGISKPFGLLEGCSDDVDMFHAVRVPAQSAIEARDKVVDALGHSPEDLKVWESTD